MVDDLAQLEAEVAALPAPGGDDPAPALDRLHQEVRALDGKWRQREQVISNVVQGAQAALRRRRLKQDTGDLDHGRDPVPGPYRQHHGVALAGQRHGGDPPRQPAHRRGEPAGGLLPRRQGARHLRPGAPHPGDPERPDPRQRLRHPVRRQVAVPGGGLLRLHQDLPRPQVGDQGAGDLPRPRARHGAPARLRQVRGADRQRPAVRQHGGRQPRHLLQPRGSRTTSATSSSPG